MAATCESCKKDCRYLRTLNKSLHMCMYCITENELRDCPPGDECTKYMKGKKVRDKNACLW